MRIDNIVAGISATIRLPSFVLTKRAKLKVENLRHLFLSVRWFARDARVCTSNRSDCEDERERKLRGAAMTSSSRSTEPYLLKTLSHACSATRRVVTIMRKLDEQDRNDFAVRRIDTCIALDNVHDYSATVIKRARYNNAEGVFQSNRDT
jgi:hypothetical protein